MGFTDIELITFMGRAIELGLHGLKPDSEIRLPYVGAVVVSPEKEIIGEGYRSLIEYTKFTRHAERMAIDDAIQSVEGSTLFTTLEPCVQLRRNTLFGPCSELIVESGIELVVVGHLDIGRSMAPFSGLEYLKRKGVKFMEFYEFEHEIEGYLLNNGN